MKALLISVLLVSLGHAADPWSHFHPEAVLSTDCKVIKVLAYSGDGRGNSEVYQAIASAKRKLEPPDNLWEMEIAREPLTKQGHRKAAIICIDWSEQAEQRIQAVQGVKK